MELSPSHVCHVPGTRVTFMCSYRSSERLEIEFDTSDTFSPMTRVRSQLTGRDVTARHRWGASRMWTVVLEPGIKMVTCRVTNSMGITVGQLHARVNTGDLCLVPCRVLKSYEFNTCLLLCGM